MKNAKKFIAICFVLFSFTYIQAQDIDTCGTIERTDEEMELLPWFGNNEYLNSINEQAESLLRDKNPVENRSGNDCGEIESDWMIPVRFWIYQASSTDPGLPTQFQLQRMMDELNRIYQSNGMHVRFFMICPQYVTDEDALTMNDWNAFWNQFAGNNTDADAINVHIIEDIEGASGTYYSFGDFIVVERGVYQSTAGATSLAHEIGHYFGLDHTHRNHDKGKCRQESVSRTRKFDFWDFCFKSGKICEKNGDALCDTPADPDLSSDDIEEDCVYNTAETDNWGDTYVPDTRNVMSYSRRSCRDNFSNGQVGIMWWSILWSGYRNFIQLIDINEINPDRFEPDDTDMPGVPRLISIGETQCHSFHRIGNCQDEMDWMRVSNVNGLLGSYQIEINDADGYDNPVEEIRVWNTDGAGLRTNQVSTINSQSGSVRMFEISCSEISNDFLVEVVRKINVQEGAYTISLNTSTTQPFIIGPSQICVGQSISLGGLPQGANVNWESSNITISTVFGPTTMITSVAGSGPPYWVQATITHNGCTYTVRKDYGSIGGSSLPPVSDISLGLEEGCDPAFFYLSIPPVSGATAYEWQCTSNNPTFFCYSSNSTATYAEATLLEGQTVNFSVTVFAMNSCGASSSITANFSYLAENCDHIPIVGGGGGESRWVKVVPNPVSSNLFTIEIVDSTTESTEYQIVITNQFGEMKYLLETDQKINQANVYNLMDGLYHVHVITDEGVISANFIVQH